MKPFHNKDYFSIALRKLSHLGMPPNRPVQKGDSHTHTRTHAHTHAHTHTRTQFNNFKSADKSFSKVVLFLFLMIAYGGGLNAQTADTPCDCIATFDRGMTGETWKISELDPIVNCTKFRGTIVIDIDTQWDNLSISMETGSSIQVETTLTIDECNIGTCDDLWRGIEVMSGQGKRIALTRSIISGANIAIELNDQAIYYISDNHFVSNYIGISTGSPFEEVSSDIQVYPKDGVILGCHFYTETQLPDPYPGHYYYPSWPLLASIPYNQGYAAMYISGSSGLYLGGLGVSGAKRNKIYNMRNGVIAKRATTKIFSTDFKNFEGSVPKRSLYVLLDYNQRAISLEGSLCHIEQDSFVNVMMGVFSTRSSQDIIHNYMNIPHQSSESSTRGIDIRQPVKTHIADNLIYNGYLGISIDYSGVSLKIEDNLLIRNVAIDGNVGINLQDIFDISPLNLVKDNEIEITGGRRSVGISMNKVQDLLLRHNTIDFLEAGPSVAGTENAGISGMQVFNSLITENIITGTSNYKTNVDNAGIMMTNSMANDLTCNETYDMFFGQWYISSNMETDLKANEFYDATHGLELWSPSALGVVSLGTQEHHANLWLGSYTFGAFIDGPDPGNTALSSRFIADESDEDPGVLIPADIGPTAIENNWFFDVTGEPAGVPCTEYPNPIPLTDSLVKLVRHPFIFTDYEDEMNWMRKADMLTFLHLYPSLLSNTVLDSFFDAEEATPLGELIASQYQMGKIHGLDPDMAEKDTLVFDYIAQVRILDSLIGLNPYNIIALKALRVLKIDTLAGHLDDWLGMLDSQITDTEEGIEDALEVVDLVTPTNDQEAELQAMLWFRGDHSRGDSLTTLELGDVYAIARQCPWLGARALSEAQSLYSVLADSIFTHRPGECVKLDFFMLEERSDKSDYIHEVRINPNPASDFLYLQLPDWVQTVEIHSLDGVKWSQLQTRSDSGGSYTMNIKDLPPGIYAINTRGGKKVETSKISITR